MNQKKLTGKGEQMKEKMVAITARILREKGFKAATVRTIAKEANVNVSAVLARALKQELNLAER